MCVNIQSSSGRSKKQRRLMYTVHDVEELVWSIILVNYTIACYYHFFITEIWVCFCLITGRDVYMYIYTYISVRPASEHCKNDKFHSCWASWSSLLFLYSLLVLGLDFDLDLDLGCCCCCCDPILGIIFLIIWWVYHPSGLWPQHVVPRWPDQWFAHFNNCIRT